MSTSVPSSVDYILARARARQRVAPPVQRIAPVVRSNDDDAWNDYFSELAGVNTWRQGH